MTSQRLLPPRCSECFERERETNSNTCFACKQEAMQRARNQQKKDRRKVLIKRIEGGDGVSSQEALKAAALALLRGEV